MEHQDFLLTLAEVAAAFVGFSMLVSALGSDRHRLHRSFLYDVAQIGFMVIGGALVPYALAATSMAPEWVWRVSSFFLSAVWVVAVVRAYRRLKVVGGDDAFKAALGPILPGLNIVVVIAGNLLLLWNVALPGPHSAARYLGALLLLLLIATYIFLRVGFAPSGDTAPGPRA